MGINLRRKLPYGADPSLQGFQPIYQSILFRLTLVASVMSYLLDTNICIYYINGQSKNLRNRIATQPRKEIFICNPVKTELFYGVYKSSQKQKNLSVLRSFLQEFESLPFDEQAAEICGKIRAELRLFKDG